MKIISDILLQEFKQSIKFSPVEAMNELAEEEISLDYFDFYNSVSSVYSSRIEGENIELDSYFKHKFQKVEFLPDVTQRVDDLFNAYFFIKTHSLTLPNLFESHRILSANLLPTHQRGRLRSTPMMVINEKANIEYVAPSQFTVSEEIEKLFSDINLLLSVEMDEIEVFYYAAFIHFVFAKIHPLSDGNGRCARLLEKWFLIEKFGENAFAIPLEKNYYIKRPEYYLNLKRSGLEYEETDYSKALAFLLMTINSVKIKLNS